MSTDLTRRATGRPRDASIDGRVLQRKVITTRVATLRTRIERAGATGELPVGVYAVRLLDLSPAGPGGRP